MGLFVSNNSEKYPAGHDFMSFTFYLDAEDKI